MQSRVVSWVASQKVCRSAANYATAWFDCPALVELSKGLAMGIQPIITISRFAGLVDIMKLQELLYRNYPLHTYDMCPYLNEGNN